MTTYLCLLALNLCGTPNSNYDFELIEGKLKKKSSVTLVLDFSKAKYSKKYCPDKNKLKKVYVEKSKCVLSHKS